MRIMKIPYDDNLKIEYLSRVFDRNRISNCYKYFWFMAILEKIEPENTIFSYDELITEMIADAWYMVSEYHLRLGPNNTTDNLEDAVKYLYYDLNHEQIASTEKKENLVNYLKNLHDKEYLNYKNKLIINVPYCLQSPFFDTKNGNLKSLGKTSIAEINRQERLLYYFSAFNKMSTTISITDEWAVYLCRNREILMDWVRYNLIGYLQDRNPSVPGIADKIIPPYKRKLDHVKKYWQKVIEADGTLREIYMGKELNTISISIDHFVPWQFVAHDELWNLSPTSKSINSKKSNNLPEWNTYFEPLSRLEYKAYLLNADNSSVNDAFNKCAEYHLNNKEIRHQLYSKGLSFPEYQTRLYNVLHPVYQAAQNCGFREWKYI